MVQILEDIGWYDEVKRSGASADFNGFLENMKQADPLTYSNFIKAIVKPVIMSKQEQAD